MLMVFFALIHLLRFALQLIDLHLLKLFFIDFCYFVVFFCIAIVVV